MSSYEAHKAMLLLVAGYLVLFFIGAKMEALREHRRLRKSDRGRREGGG